MIDFLIVDGQTNLKKIQQQKVYLQMISHKELGNWWGLC